MTTIPQNPQAAQQGQDQAGQGVTKAEPMSLCPEHDLRVGMTDAEFWQHVYPNGRDWEPEPEDCPVLVAFHCLRCGGPVEVDDYAEMVDRQFDDFCDDCADEQLPDEDVPR